MAIQQNQKKIRTTHIGSLPRPHAVLDLLKLKLNGQPLSLIHISEPTRPY